MEEIGERWDRLGPYTESDFEILQVANMVEEEEKEKDLPGLLMPARGKRKRRRGGQLTFVMLFINQLGCRRVKSLDS